MTHNTLYRGRKKEKTNAKFEFPVSKLWGVELSFISLRKISDFSWTFKIHVNSMISEKSTIRHLLFTSLLMFILATLLLCACVLQNTHFLIYWFIFQWFIHFLIFSPTFKYTLENDNFMYIYYFEDDKSNGGVHFFPLFQIWAEMMTS